MLNKKVTVLMPVYNGQDYLKSAIESVLNQTYSNLDLLIINDGSTDDSDKIITSFSDNRIIYIENESNLGLIKTLNKGLKMIEGEYIVRMDADDICLPHKIEKQVDFMDDNKHIAVSGTSVKKFNKSGFLKQEYVRTAPEDLKTQLLFGSPLRHPTVILRNSIFVKEEYGYDIMLDTVEDYGLWEEIAENYPLSNLKEPLLEYRINNQGITQQAEKKIVFRDNQHKIIYKRIFKTLEINVSEKDLQLYREFVMKRSNLREVNMKDLNELLLTIKNAADNRAYNLKLLDQYIKRFFTDICTKNKITYFEWKDYYKKYFPELFKWTLVDDLKFISKKVRSK